MVWAPGLASQWLEASGLRFRSSSNVSGSRVACLASALQISVPTHFLMAECQAIRETVGKQHLKMG